MPEPFIWSCSSALTNLISSDRIQENQEPFKAFSEGILNFYAHYCLDDHTSSWCTHEKVQILQASSQTLNNAPSLLTASQDKTYSFTCQAQAEAFKELLTNMSKKPQDYVSDRGRTTTNAVEGFHGIALRYRSKRTDLGHTHYVCKTNMAICHKVQLYVQYSNLHTGILTEPGSNLESDLPPEITDADSRTCN